VPKAELFGEKLKMHTADELFPILEDASQKRFAESYKGLGHLVHSRRQPG
jgi:hypothetical protein